MSSRSLLNKEFSITAKLLTETLGYTGNGKTGKWLASSGGTEACESACKLSRKWGYKQKGVPENQANILMATNCFWGRSITAISGCSDKLRQKQFGPFTPGFPLVPFNDLPAIEEYLKNDPNCVAVFLEPIQGEGGGIVPELGYLKKVKALCKKYNVLLVTDEVQTGLCRTGKMMAYDHDLEGDLPDITTLGKALSGAVTPVSGIVASTELMDNFEVGEHGSTFQGNPLGMVVAKAALEVLVEENLAENSAKMGKLMGDGFKGFNSPMVKDVRGRGLMQYLEIRDDLKVNGHDLGDILYRNGVLTKAGQNYNLRFTPPLVVNEDETMEIVDIVGKSLKQLEELNDSR